MSTNLLRIAILFSAFYVTIVGLLLRYLEPYMPVVISRLYRYGKFGIKTNASYLSIFEVPKGWFKQFYVFAAIVFTSIFLLMLQKYLFNDGMPESLLWILDASLGTPRRALVTRESAFLAFTLMTIHVNKRFYESFYVSIFSDAKINISHYLVGYFHYIWTPLCIIGESEDFFKGSTGHLSWHRITHLQLFCAVIFLIASYAQYRSNIILRKLRVTENKKIASNSYKIPHGELFHYVSNPLQTTEIIIYLMISIILWECQTFHYVTLWVLSNQVLSALLSHSWYCKTFKNYPKHRKAIIPYVL